MKRAAVGAVVTAIIMTTMLIVASGPAGALPTAAERCAAAKMRAAGKKASASAGCMARSYVNPDFDVDTCLSNASDAFNNAFARAESAAVSGGGCATVDDAADVEFEVDDFVDTLDTDVAP
jgi:20S proteasome alpha/beta subunit